MPSDASEGGWQDQPLVGSHEQHPLVKALVDDPAAPAEYDVLVGYNGKSSRRAHIRIYLGLDLSGWVDVPTADVKRMQRLSQGSLSPTVIWVTRGARVRPGLATGKRAEDFLQGAITLEQLQEAAAVSYEAFGTFGGLTDTPVGRWTTLRGPRPPQPPPPPGPAED
jgi:hypothetical protein